VHGTKASATFQRMVPTRHAEGYAKAQKLAQPHMHSQFAWFVQEFGKAQESQVVFASVVGS